MKQNICAIVADQSKFLDGCHSRIIRPAPLALLIAAAASRGPAENDCWLADIGRIRSALPRDAPRVRQMQLACSDVDYR
jgi:hypothetical protein